MIEESRPTTGLLSRVVGMIWSPHATLTDVVADPRWLAMLFVVMAIPALVNGVMLSTEVGQRAMLEQQVESIENFGGEVTDEMYEGLEARSGFGAYFAAGSVFVFVPVVTLIVATFLFVVSHGFLGGTVSFKQIYAVVIHAGVVFIVQALFVGPLNYFRAEMSNPTTLAAFLPMLESDTFVSRFLGVIDVFQLWWLIVLAMGTAIATGRRTTPIAVALFGLYIVIGFGIAVVMTQFAS